MFFIVLTFFTALLIEGLGSFVSVLGISRIFGLDAIIITLAVALDLGKIVTVSLLYTHWNRLLKWMKVYALLAAAITMSITSAGAAGYLASSFQGAIISTKEGELQVQTLKEQQAKYQLRKKQIDDQIANLPANYSRARIALMKQFQAEQEVLNARLAEIDKQLPTLQLKQLNTETKAGPILYIAQAFNISADQAMKYVILLIIFVFDPLAIFLIVAGNFLWAQRKAELSKVPHKTEHSKPFKPETAESTQDFNPLEPAKEYKPIFEFLKPTPVSEPENYLYNTDYLSTVGAQAAKAAHDEHIQTDRLATSGNIDSENTTEAVVVDISEPSKVDGGLFPEHKIASSSLKDIEPDPNTIVDAHYQKEQRSKLVAPRKNI